MANPADENTGRCPWCGIAIPTSHVDIDSRKAYCHSCRSTVLTCGLVHDHGFATKVDLLHPPPGVTHKSNDNALVVTARHPSMCGAIGNLLLAAFTANVICVIALLAVGCALVHLVVPLPIRIPLIGADGPAAALWLVLLPPSAALALRTLGALILATQNRTEIRLDHEHGSILTGTPGFYHQQDFSTPEITGIHIADYQQELFDGSHRVTYVVIQFRDAPPIGFGYCASRDQLRFLVASLQRATV